MKKCIVVFLLSFGLYSCNSGDDEMALAMNQLDLNENADAIKGNFVSDAHPTSGEAIVSDDKSILSLSNFKTDDGPKLLLYLSTEVSSTEFVNLGDLKGVEGNFTYTIPDDTDLEKYKFVVVWCVDFSVSFGHAELK